MSPVLTLCRASAGTGKTYTLTHRYVDLLMGGEAYRSILAITFTNKATAEMKERILTLLYEESLKEGKRAEKANVLFHTILADFDNLRVMTIDSFLQALMRGLALTLEKAAGYTIDLDTEHAIITAVDQIMTSHIDEQPGLRAMITELVKRQLDAGDRWDFRGETIALAKQLFVESVQRAEADGKDIFDRKRIEAFRKESDALKAQTDMEARVSVTTAHFKDLLQLSYVRNRIEANLLENNSILLANTAAILKRALKSGDADFILEKAGIRYKHIMVDEFQDTSDLQWYTIFELIKEVLSTGGTSLIVGDIKQSIYRWRNGNWHIMADLDKHPAVKNYIAPMPLVRNRRSAREVVRFNLDTFRTIAAPYDFYQEGYDGHNLDDFYLSGEKEGGYVELRFYPKAARTNKDFSADAQRETIIRDMFERIEQLLAQGVPPKDILILIRMGKYNDALISVYDRMMQEGQYPYLQAHKPISGDSYRVESSPAVLTVIAELRAVANKASTLALNASLPLSLLVEEIIRLKLCPDGQYHGDDVAYINAFRDKVLTYASHYGSDIHAFLRYWDDSLHNESIPTVNAGEIRVMTIHSSKGLEAPYVFVPFCSWKMENDDRQAGILWAEPSYQVNSPLDLVPVDNKTVLRDTGYERVYHEEHQDERIDNTNLLYVALTRAGEHLYLYCDIDYSKSLKRTPINIPEAKTVAHALLEAHHCAQGLVEVVESYDLKHEHCYVYQRGTDTLTETKHAQTSAPFSFDEAQQVEGVFYSSAYPVQFRQSVEAVQFASHDTNKTRNFGNLCHDILAHIITIDDVDRVIATYWSKGEIDTEESRAHISSLIHTMFAHDEIADWFSGQYKVLSERTILLDPVTEHDLHSLSSEQRPDRVMIMGTKAIVLDYKFGEYEKEAHLRQVRAYMELMRQLGYQEVEGYLYYAEKDSIKPVTP